MNELEKKQVIEDQNYQYRLQLEQIQDSQLTNRTEQRYIEDLQDHFFHLQQQEQQLFQQSIAESEPEDRAFFEARSDENLHLSKKALGELEDELVQLQQEKRSLLEQEDKLINNQLIVLEFWYVRVWQ